MHETIPQFEKHSSDAACRIAELAIEDFAQEVLILRERLDHVESLGATYRVLFQGSMDAVHHLTQQRDTLRKQLTRQRNEDRALREELAQLRTLTTARYESRFVERSSYDDAPS